MITKEYFDCYLGEASYNYVISANGISVTVCDFGAAVTSIRLNTALGVKDICLSFPSIEAYLKSGAYCGATVGRVANRIRRARFTLNGREYTLSANEGRNTLHGGKNGFPYRLWHAEICGDVLRLTLESADGDQGFPHNLRMTVEYEIVGNSLEIRYSAQSDGDTV